jgi:hypothetical protein
VRERQAVGRANEDARFWLTPQPTHLRRRKLLAWAPEHDSVGLLQHIQRDFVLVAVVQASVVVRARAHTHAHITRTHYTHTQREYTHTATGRQRNTSQTPRIGSPAPACCMCGNVQNPAQQQHTAPRGGCWGMRAGETRCRLPWQRAATAAGAGIQRAREVHAPPNHPPTRSPRGTRPTERALGVGGGGRQGGMGVGGCPSLPSLNPPPRAVRRTARPREHRAASPPPTHAQSAGTASV